MKLKLDDVDVLAVYEAVEQFKQRSLRGLLSAFLADDDPDVARVWTVDSARELIARFVENPDEGKRKFFDKLGDQMEGASRPAAQLLEELAWLHFLISRPIRYETKQQLLAQFTAFGEVVGPSGIFDAALKRGIANTGTSFNTRRPQQLWLMVRFSFAWTSASSKERENWLDDPWAFRDLVFSLEGRADQTTRNALIHLVHPDTFEDCVSQSHKAQMAAIALPAEVGDNVDRTIFNLRQRLSGTLGEGFWFYSDDVQPLWRTDANKPDEQTEPKLDTGLADVVDPRTDRSAWLIRGSGGQRVSEWLERGICAVYFEDTFPFEIAAGTSKDELRTAAEQAGVDTTFGGFSNELGQVWRFVNSVAVGDFVVTVNGKEIYVGIVESESHSVVGRTRSETFRSVEWLNVGDPISRSDVSPPMFSKLKTLLTLSNITSVVDEIELWISGQKIPGNAATKSDALILRPSTDELAKSLVLPNPWLDEVIGLLEQKRQLVLFGPPGTGKTFLAQELAEHLSGVGKTELVQFHPSYTYEDFFEGYRPVSTTGGSVAFEIKPGPLRRLAAAAAQDPETPYVLIIDEINRANLAKVFGELYFLLEYRQQAITLQYSDDEFVLPANLYVIGTMNTADRSIALVDAAMRRRFYFVEMTPLADPVDKVLAGWLSQRGLSDLPARMLDELNRRLSDPDAAIGPSYLMSERVADPAYIEQIWNYAILPLLEERFYGTGDTLEQFSFRSVFEAISETSEA
jgi:5-methylcytosine-specific restriction protein B